jgi:renal tumor antigen
MRKYRLVAKKGEGTFSEVLKAQNVKDSKYHAIKCMKNHFESIEQVNNLREIQALRRLSPHQHIVKLEEVLYDQPSGRLALVFELMDANLYEMIRGRRHYLKPELIQSLMYQLVKSLDHMHNKGIFHRDIKPENILVEDSSKLKLADFGSCRGIYSKQPYTEYISTRWYRAPECLLTDGYYGPEMDMWGVGCVFFEITSLYPLFPGSNELDQIHRIHKIMGTPSPDVLEVFKRRGAAHVDFNFPKEDGTSIAKLIPHASPAAIDLMLKMLAYDPGKRMNAREALRHEYFREIRELEEATLRSQQQQQQQQQQQVPSYPQPVQPPSLKQRKLKEESPEDKLPLPSIPSAYARSADA